MSGSPLAIPVGRRAVSSAASSAASGALAHALAALQHLSLDIVVGVVCAAAFATTIVGAAMPLSWWILLPLATWVVYSTDHLLDAYRTGAGAQQLRHRFYHEWFGPLAVLTGGVAIAGVLAALWWLPGRLLTGGLLAAVAAVAHLVLAQGDGRIVTKEISTAVIYVGAIWFGPLLVVPGPEGWAFAALHLLAALSNLLAFALFEERVDRLDGHASIVRSWGRPATARLLRWFTAIGVAGLLSTAVLAPAPRPAALLVLLALILIPSTMVLKHRVFAPGQRYRAVGDLAFWLMLLPFLLAN